MEIRIDKAKAQKKWKPVLENMGVTEAERIDWMAEYAEFHTINENAYANQGNVFGMGNVQSAQPSGLPGQAIGGYGQAGNAYGDGGEVGSGDYGQQLLPVAMKIAAHTIGLDLVSVKPSPGPKIDLMYIDFRYDDNVDGLSEDERPQVFKINYGADEAAFKTYLEGILSSEGVTETVGGLTERVYVDFGASPALADHLTEPTTSKAGILEFLGFSRIDGLPMFRAYRQANTASAPSQANTWGFDSARNSFSLNTSMAAQLGSATWAAAINSSPSVTFSPTSPTDVSVELVSALEDHLPGFAANWYSNDYPMERGEDDRTYPGIIAPNVSTKTIAVGTIEISTALKRTEIEDIKANTGIDIVQKMESILVNELSQTISKQIVNKVFEMGDLNRTSAPTIGATTNISDATVFDYDVQDHFTNMGGVGGSGETSHAAQRKLITKILNASNFIATEGRVGPAQYVVTNGNLAAALQDIAGYTINPTKSKLNGSGQLYPVGTIGDVSIYVDPYMKYNDNRILVGRKNQPDQPGIVFVPYLMAQSISIISEATFAPRMLLRSRYAVAELGWYPQKQYMTIKVADPDQILA